MEAIFKSTSYAILFGLMGLIIGIWFADLLYSLILKDIAATYISLIIIILFIVLASILGFTKGKSLLE